MYATDQIYQKRLWQREEAGAKEAEESSRWAWHAEHLPKCTKTDVVITVIADATFTEPCCPACWHEVWKHEENARLLNQYRILPARLAA